MSTMLSDKGEQLGAGSPGAAGLGASGAGMGGLGSAGTMTVEVTEIPVTDSGAGAGLGDCGCAGVASNTKQVLADVGPAVKADAQELKFRAEDYVIENPLKAVGIAAGVGFVLGVLWTASGRRSSRHYC